MSSAYHKRAIPCDICGQNFFPSSLPFHQKQCAVKQQFVEVPCPFCDIPIQNCQLNYHIARECKKPSTTRSVAHPTGIVSDGRFPCSVCGRRFAGGDRLVKHQKICRKNSMSRSASSLTVSSTRTTPSPPPEGTNKGWTWSSDWRQRRDEMKLNMRTMTKTKDPQSIEFVLVTKEGQKTDHEHEDEVDLRDDSVDSLEGCFPFEQDSLEVDDEVLQPLNNLSPDSLDEPILEARPIEKREATAWTIDWGLSKPVNKPIQPKPPQIQEREIIRFNDENVQPVRTPPKLLLNTLATRGGVTVFNTNRRTSSMKFN